jgi:DNA repair protein RecO (recombination protein O)
MRNFTTEGVIIKRRNHNDSDRILTVLTKDRGKIQVRAAGVRKISSRRSSHVELLNRTVLNLYKGPVFIVLTEAQVLQTYPELKSDLLKIGFAYHICELIDGLCPEQQEQKAVFRLLCQTLHELTQGGAPAQIIHDFEIELLILLGYWDREEPNHNLNTQLFIENILERKLKSKRFLHMLN